MNSEKVKTTKYKMSCQTPKKFAPSATSTLRPGKKCSHSGESRVVRRSFLARTDNKRRFSLALAKSIDVEIAEPKLKRKRLSINNWLESRNFSCDICGRRFFHESAIIAHSLSHTSTPPLKRRQIAVETRKKGMRSLVKKLKSKLSK